VAVVAGALVLAVGAGVWYGSGRTPQATAIPGVGVAVPSTTVPSTIVVHVSGAVLHPGLVTVPVDGRAADAIAAAGGATGGADLGSINLAAPLRDGEQIVVPMPGAASPPSGSAAPDGVDLNRANASELEALPGVGPVLAARIVAYRDLNGPFSTVEDLLDVGGIGEAKLAAMRDAIAVP
jgi:competence protein ComEA